MIALVSPIHRLGETLFAVHMVQHGILILIAAPLLVLGRPLLPFLFALPMSWRSELGRLAKSNGFQAGWATVTTPYAAWALQGAALWLWHLPVLYQRTVENDFVHAAQHTSFLLSGLLFWWVIFRNAHDASSCGIGAVAVFTTALHTSILGALLTVSGSLWYPIYALRTAPWGLTPLEDQQLAGLIMWVPCGVVYLVAGLVLVFQWINKSESRVTSISTL